jgi:hypothetical protein
MAANLDNGEQETGFCNDFMFGGCKGRDRNLLLWVIDALTYIERLDKRNGGTIFILCQDVSNAYPGLWQRAADWCLRKRGARGKTWRIAAMLETGMSSVVRLNGHMTGKSECPAPR